MMNLKYLEGNNHGIGYFKIKRLGISLQEVNKANRFS
jgi:hypothetical protein